MDADVGRFTTDISPTLVAAVLTIEWCASAVDSRPVFVCNDAPGTRPSTISYAIGGSKDSGAADVAASMAGAEEPEIRFSTPGARFDHEDEEDDLIVPWRAGKAGAPGSPASRGLEVLCERSTGR